ncbi:MAG: pyruvate, phosphate dikinase [Acidobacteriota bacterium]
MKKFCYFFGGGSAEGNAGMKDILGGKGANIAEMTNLGIPVPPGFTISSEACRHYFQNNGRLPDGLEEEVRKNTARIEKLQGLRFGDELKPLIVSIRSGSKFSMPGMMDTVLNLGLNEKTVRGLAKLTGNERFAYDCYRRFIQMYGEVVLGIHKEKFSKILQEAKDKRGIINDFNLTADDWKNIVKLYIAEIAKSREFPDKPNDQLWGAIVAVFESWNNPRAKFYRKIHGISDHWGTAVNVQVMVFGNMGNNSATGVAFTRDPATGEERFFGEYLKNAQGEDVVAGIRTPQPLAKEKDSNLISLEEEMPEIYADLLKIYRRLEDHYRDMQDIEFTIQEGKLFILQTRTGKRTGFASVRIAVDMVRKGLITEEEAVLRVEPDQIIHLLAPVFKPEEKEAAIKGGRALGKGLNAGPGASSGRVALSAEKVIEMSRDGDSVILVRVETSPEDIAGMKNAKGILTARGGMTSHAAVVARGMGKSCVVGCGKMVVDYENRKIRFDNIILKEGDYISIDGMTGEVIQGELSTIPSEIMRVLVEKSIRPEESDIYQHFALLMSWADRRRKLGVRANADTPFDAKIARSFGAEGIGLARTEHMFFGKDRILAVREMILSDTKEERERALGKILPMQRDDFKEIFREMNGLPVTIRLLDPPLHEFLPHEESQIEEVASEMEVAVEKLREKVHSLHEMNPMLGHRGCRLGITFPEIYRMQVRAIIEAACLTATEGVNVIPEIMIPLVGITSEFKMLRELIDDVARETMRREGKKIEYRVGTMMEIPRACLVASEIGEEADFFSFGTNDLTQMTFGFSRDDAGVFLPEFVELSILKKDPFQHIDTEGVGRLVRIGAEEGRKQKPSLKIGVCGEHGGDPDSIHFFHFAGLDYVSCSPYRVPVARLAAAHAALKGEYPEEKD